MHISVLRREVVENLRAGQGGVFVDGTAGDGGHAKAILQAHPANRVLAIDLDKAAVEKLQQEFVQSGLGQRCAVVAGNYKNLDSIAQAQGIDSVDGIVLDLGFSSVQVDDPERGFSFQTPGPLDMRYDTDQELTAYDVVNVYPEKDLVRILQEFGEERLAKKIGREIVRRRKLSPIATTAELAEVVRQSVPLPVRFKAAESIRRVFQAIRIEVNAELDNLKMALPRAVSLLKPGGFLTIISFHSLEDRIVKDFFQEQAKECVCPPEFPTCVCDKNPELRILTRKPIIASEEELKQNSRSKPAKLRVAQKI